MSVNIFIGNAWLRWQGCVASTLKLHCPAAVNALAPRCRAPISLRQRNCRTHTCQATVAVVAALHPSLHPCHPCSIDEAEYEEPEKIGQSPLTFEGFAPGLSTFVLTWVTGFTLAHPTT